MPRPNREWTPGIPYHIYSRGNRRTDIFREHTDYITFLRLPENARRKHGFKMHSICLMTNHFHFILESDRVSISDIMMVPLHSYSMYFNKKYDFTGHVFGGRFQSKPVKDENYFLELTRYIHLNPIKAGLAVYPDEYPYSSYALFLSPNQVSLPRPATEASALIRSLIDPGKTLSLLDSQSYRDFVETNPPADTAS